MVTHMSRFTFAALVVACTMVSAPAVAQVKELLGKASDAALDQLGKPGAFSADDAIRIGLPGQAKGLGDLMKLSDRAGLTQDISGSLNRAAEQAAAEAKPIFRAAIDRATLKDAVAIGRGGDTGATDYLRQSAGGDILKKLTPLVKSALDRTGVLKQTSQLASFGMDDAKITDYVAKKTADGIFTYVGREETKLRRDPIGIGRSLMKDLKF